MTAAAEMPEDVMRAAREVVADFYSEQSAHEEVERILAGMRDHWSEIRVACRAILAERQRDQWQDISTAPDLERVMVAGWQEPSGSVAGYWWWHEDACQDGVALDHPNATHWCNVRLPAFPAAPKGGA